MARRLQNHLALAHFKVTRGWEDLPLDIIELRINKELRSEHFSSPLRTPSKRVHFKLGQRIIAPGSDMLSFPDDVHMTNYMATPDEEDDLLPVHSLKISSMSSPPPPGQGSVTLDSKTTNGRFGQEGDLPPHLANCRSQMHTMSTPPRHLAPQSLIMTMFGWDGAMLGFRGLNTASQEDDFSDFVNIPPRPTLTTHCISHLITSS